MFCRLYSLWQTPGLFKPPLWIGLRSYPNDPIRWILKSARSAAVKAAERFSLRLEQRNEAVIRLR